MRKLKNKKFVIAAGAALGAVVHSAWSAFSGDFWKATIGPFVKPVLSFLSGRSLAAAARFGLAVAA